MLQTAKPQELPVTLACLLEGLVQHYRPDAHHGKRDSVAAEVQRTSPEEGEEASDSRHAGGSKEPPGTI